MCHVNRSGQVTVDLESPSKKVVLLTVNSISHDQKIDFLRSRVPEKYFKATQILHIKYIDSASTKSNRHYQVSQRMFHE